MSVPRCQLSTSRLSRCCASVRSSNVAHTSSRRRPFHSPTGHYLNETKTCTSPISRHASRRRFATSTDSIKKNEGRHEEQQGQRQRGEGEGISKSARIAIAAGLAGLIALGTTVVGKSTSSSAEFKGFDAQKFTKCTITSKIPVSSTAFIYTVRPASASKLSAADLHDVYQKYWGQGLWSLEFKQPALQIARSYTPLPPRGEGDDELRFHIRKMQGGEMSNYLSRLDVGDTVEIRGPDVEFEVPGDAEKRSADIVFLAGGTGLACALQAAHTFLSSDGDGKASSLRLLWANRRREDCAGAPRPAVASGWAFWKNAPKVEQAEETNAIMDEILRMQKLYGDKLSVEYFVDDEGKFITADVVKKAGADVDAASQGRRKLFMVSGPDGFVEHFAGKKGDWVGSKQAQGLVGGVAKSLSLNGWEVVKL